MPWNILQKEFIVCEPFRRRESDIIYENSLWGDCPQQGDITRYMTNIDGHKGVSNEEV